MFEQFDDNENDERIKKTAGTEFIHLKQLMSQIEGKQYKGEFFNWTESSGSGGILLLGEVAAQLIAWRGTYNVRFGQRPYSAHEQSPGALVYPENWELTPDVLEGGFIWMIDGKRYPPETLAESIAAKLAKVYDNFKEGARL
jgi:hypothetical protein